MAGQVWQVAADGGYMANPRLSRQIRHVAQPRMKFRQFVRPEPGYGKAKGDKIEFLRISNVSDEGGKISETVKMPETKVTITKGNVTVDEFGNSIPYTGKLEALSEFSVENIWTVALRDDMAKILDKWCAIAFKLAKVKYVPTGTSGSPTASVTTNGTPGASATRDVAMFDVKEIIDYLKYDLLCPAYDGENYVSIATTSFLRKIQDDSDWKDAAKYGDPERLFKGEVGRIYGCRFIEETNVLTKLLGTTAYKGEAIFFGADPVVEGVVIPEEIRAKIPSDYGRDKGVAWYYMGGYNTTWDTGNKGEAKIVHATSL